MNRYYIAIGINVILAVLVALGFDGGYSAPLWIFSTCLLVWQPVPEILKLRIEKIFSLKSIFLSFVLLLPAIVRCFSIDYDFVHRDEFIVAWFSHAYDLLRTPFFQPVPTPNDWVAQFPSLYFFIQKIIFLAVGESPLTVKLSILPYVILAAYSIFLIGRKILGPAGACVVVVMYAFFSPSMYFEIFGLHIIGSMAVFAFFCATLFEEKRGITIDVWTGIAFAVCFLHYTSSYLALPVLCVYAFYRLLYFRSKESIHSLIRIAGIASLVLLPFASHWIFENFYVIQRTKQMSLLTGSWSHEAEAISKGASIIAVVWESFIRCVKSFALDTYGGNGDYNFGHVSLLDIYSLFFFVAGLIALSLKAFKEASYFYLLSIVVLGFLFGAVLTTSNPVAFHRLSIIFPFIPFVCFIPVWKLASKRYLIVDIFLVVWITLNTLHFLEFKQRDREIGIEMTDDVIVMKYLKESFPKVPIKVAAFPGLAFGWLVHFYDNGTVAETRYHREFLDTLDPTKPYLYVILDLDGFPALFQQKDPKGRLVELGPRRLKVFTNIPSSSE